MDTIVLEYLRSKEEPISTLTLARLAVGENAKAKDINPTLYSLERKGLVVKVTEEGGRNPRWSAISGASEKLQEEEELERKTLEFLNPASVVAIPGLANVETTQSTLAIAKAVLGEKARTKDINPILYSLEKKGKVMKKAEENGKKPRWEAVMA